MWCFIRLHVHASICSRNVAEYHPLWRSRNVSSGRSCTRWARPFSSHGDCKCWKVQGNSVRSLSCCKLAVQVFIYFFERCDECEDDALDTSRSRNVAKCFHYTTTIHLGVVQQISDACVRGTLKYSSEILGERLLCESLVVAIVETLRRVWSAVEAEHQSAVTRIQWT